MTGGTFEYEDVRELYKALAGIPKALRSEARPIMREAGQKMLADARANASWSSRIPAALTLTVNLSTRRPGLVLRASLAKAPHARVYEGLVAPTFKSPLFGDREWWYEHAARPYIVPAAAANQQQLIDAVVAAITRVQARAGLT